MKPKLRVYTCTNFTGHYPVGVSAVIVAKSRAAAAKQLNLALENENLPQSKRRTAADMTLVSTAKESVEILQNGDY